MRRKRPTSDRTRRRSASGVGPQGDADADLPPPLRHAESQHAVNPEGGEPCGKTAEGGRQDRDHLARHQRLGDLRGERLHVEDRQLGIQAPHFVADRRDEPRGVASVRT